MANIIDYLKWKGDVALKENALNAIDALILTNFGYIHFDELIEQKITIGELGKRYAQLPQEIREKKWRVQDDYELVKAMMNSSRFSTLEISDYLKEYDYEQEMQFSAMTVHTSDGIIVIFRGTDSSFVGWKEDFNMFSCDEIPAQTASIHYLNTIAEKYPNQKIRVAGHSKGGNLAVYAVAKSEAFVRERVERIYNFDGPGFSNGFLELASYQEIRNRIQTVIPQSAFFGLVFNNDVKMEIVKSNQYGVMQHDAYSWQILGSSFEHVKELSTTSNLLQKTLNYVLARLTLTQRKQLVDLIYHALLETQSDSTSTFIKNWFTNLKTLIKETQELNQEETTFLSESLGIFAEAAKESLSETILPWKKENQEIVLPHPQDHMLNLEGAQNVRDLGGYITLNGIIKEHVFLRSDATMQLTSNDIDWLKAYGCTAILDLRSNFEVDKQPSLFKYRTDFAYYHIPMLDQIQSNDQVQLPKSLFETYVDLLEHSKEDFQSIMKILANEPGTVLFHCTAGKDRTGVLSMLLLDLVGVDRPTIVKDYAISEQNLIESSKKQVEHLSKLGLVGVDYLFQSKPETMKQTLDYLYSHYTDAQHYLMDCGVSSEIIKKIKNKLVNE